MNFCLIMKRCLEINFTSSEELDICDSCVHEYYVSFQNKCVRTLSRCWILASCRWMKTLIRLQVSRQTGGSQEVSVATPPPPQQKQCLISQLDGRIIDSVSYRAASTCFYVCVCVCVCRRQPVLMSSPSWRCTGAPRFCRWRWRRCCRPSCSPSSVSWSLKMWDQTQTHTCI